MFRFAAPLVAIAALTACDMSRDTANAEFSRMGNDIRGAGNSFVQGVSDLRADLLGRAFADNTVSIVANRHGDLDTYVLVRCAVEYVCVGNAHGRRAQLVAVEDATVRITGLASGHTYYLAPGGTGYVDVHDGTIAPLAWD